MVKNQIKAKNMAQKENKGYAIRLTPELSEGLRYIANKTNKTQIGILEEILTPMIDIGASYEDFGYWVFENDNTITIQFFGKSRMIFGKNTLNDDEAMAELSQTINEKLVRKSEKSQKLKPMEIAQ